MTSLGQNTPPTEPSSPASESRSDVPTPLLVDRATAARLLGISTRTVWKLSARGELSYLKVGRAVRYLVRDLERWIEKTKRRTMAHTRTPVDTSCPRDSIQP